MAVPANPLKSIVPFIIMLLEIKFTALPPAEFIVASLFVPLPILKGFVAEPYNTSLFLPPPP